MPFLPSALAEWHTWWMTRRKDKDASDLSRKRASSALNFHGEARYRGSSSRSDYRYPRRRYRHCRHRFNCGPLPANRRTLLVAAAVMLCSPSTVDRCAGEIQSVSRVYHSACLERGQKYWDYDNFQLGSLKWEDPDRYEITARLGFGRFSEVLEGVISESGRKVVLKVLKPARIYKIKREIKVLQSLAGGVNVLKLEGVCRDRHTGITTLVLEYLGDHVQWFGHTASCPPLKTAGVANTSPRVPGVDTAAAREAFPRGARKVSSPGSKMDRGVGGAGTAASSIGRDRRRIPTATVHPKPGNGIAADTTTAGAGASAPPVVPPTAACETGLDTREAGRASGGLGDEHSTGVSRDTAWSDGDRERTGLSVSGQVAGVDTRSSEDVGGRGSDGKGNGQVGGDGGREELESGRLTDFEVRFYLYKLLQALDFAHSRGVVHRDVKPRNVVINRRTRTLRLIDWGLGDFYIPGRRNMARVGSRYYKAPELLMGFRFYDYAIDMFSVGCILAGFLLNREPFFRGKDNGDQLVRIATVLGTEGLHSFLRKYDVVLEPRLLNMLGTHRKKPWSIMEGGGTKGELSCSQEGFDLLDRMLCYDHQERISAGEALSHAFFDVVRGEIEAQAQSSDGAAKGLQEVDGTSRQSAVPQR